MEKVVETWLDNNPDWFRTYVMRSLDQKTVNDWIAQNKRDSTNNGANENHHHHQQQPVQDGIEKLIYFKPTLKMYTVKFASTEKANRTLSSSAELVPGQQQRANRSQSLTTRHMQECRAPQQQQQHLPNQTISKLKIPSLDVESIRHKSNSPPNPRINIEDEKHMFFIKDDKSELLNTNNSNGLSSNAIGPSYSPNNETHNLISLNMVKRSKLIAMRKYNTMVPNTHHQSLDEILKNTKQKLAMSLAASQAPLQLANDSNKQKDNPEFLVEVIKDISSELDLKLLSKKIVNNVKLMVDTDEVALFFVTRNSTQSTAFKSTIYSYVNDKKADSEMKAIVETNYFIKRVIETGELVNIEDVQKEKETNLMLNKVSPQIKSVLCIPIKNPAGQVLAVVQFTINSDSSHEKPGGFTDTDINVSSSLNPLFREVPPE